MATELVLHHTEASGLLVPARLTEGLALSLPRGRVQGNEMRLAIDLPLDDAACAGFVLEIVGQGRRVRGAAHGPSAALLSWAFHTEAFTLGADLVDPDADKVIVPNTEPFSEAALAYVTRHEAEVRAAREGRAEVGGAAFLEWLAREEHIAFAEDAEGLGESLSMDDPVGLYEMLLENDAIDDVFVSERELAGLLARFRAR